ncbi:MAG: hypothetical protein HKL95_01700 [Phycisphaerae bacterium]|nr:hypothetical protein [Phycisphaerae bacterium]
MDRHWIYADYMPDNTGCTLASVHFLTTPGGRELLESVERIADIAHMDVASIAHLRRRWSAQHIHAATTICECRRRASADTGKFFASHMSPHEFWAVPEALEQATSQAVAAHKATRFAAAMPGSLILDACCGIGGDAFGLAAAGPVLAVEVDPLRAWLAHHNTRAIKTRHPLTVIQADIRQAPFQISSIAGFHIDPARRSGGRRSPRYEDMFPEPAIIEALIRQIPCGAVKLSPATDFSKLPPGHLELISENRVTVQAVLWTGKIAATLDSTARSATIIRKHRPPWSITGKPESITRLFPPATWIYEVDGAVIRSSLCPELLRRVSCSALSNDGGYITSVNDLTHPALTAFRVSHVMDYSPRNLKHWLGENKIPTASAGGCIEIKTRGGLGIDTDALQRRLKDFGPWTILIYRGINGITAAITQRPSAQPASDSIHVAR